MNEEPPKPHFYSNAKEKPKITFVYQLTKDKVPLSYTRVYTKSWDNIIEIEKYLEGYYRDNTEKKLFLGDLARGMELSETITSKYILMMCTVKQVREDFKGETKIIRDKPLCIIQQAVRHTSKRYFSIRTPIYVTPFAKEYLPQTQKEVKVQNED